MSHFWFYVQQWQRTQDLTGELNLLRRMEVTTENSVTMASGHFYESICMAHNQEPPSRPPTPGVCTVLVFGAKSKSTISSQGNEMSCSHWTCQYYVCITFRQQFWAIISNLSQLNVYSRILIVCHSFTITLITNPKYLQQICHLIIMREGLEGRIRRALEMFFHSVVKNSSAHPQRVVGATLLQHLTSRLW